LPYATGYVFSGNVGRLSKSSYNSLQIRPTNGSKGDAKPAILAGKRRNILKSNDFGAADNMQLAFRPSAALPAVHWLLPKSNMSPANIIGELRLWENRLACCGL
jgi:hypothetical protein